MSQLDDNALAIRLVDWTRRDCQSPYFLGRLITDLSNTLLAYLRENPI